jgi:8-oxo-dGTP pyrophosphatase MutT (NUDIX family)
MMRDAVIGALKAAPPPVLDVPISDWETEPARKQAAVLVPLVDHSGGMSIIFGQKADNLRTHAGQISFPGGRIEPGDADEAAAALREAEEEVALDPRQVEIVGRLNTHRAGSGYAIAPMVGIVKPPVKLRPDGVEFIDAFEVPLDFLADPANHRRESMFWRGADRWYSVFEYQDRYIWGATAAILVNLAAVLKGVR